ncbi:hypothetical protein C8A03DRAFT_48321 [Achaetomium macrosporum]|uniref:BZIP domain-containing protein n=1 Tax=Achaetomium macrosporum TaxID=79813 RepID=A0AAN7C0H1_9PEZI|nr:hypothetical protein C8A03DRAFT_48321 [Achaetomium macrosporum]
MEETTYLLSPPDDKKSADQHVDESHHKNKREAMPLTRCLQRRTQTSDAARTSRLTENKRRYRARQKEYVADLERSLAESRVQGIKATKEVQLAARKVVAENGRLRELLRLVGFADEDIDVWAKREHGGTKADGTDCARRREIEQKARLYETFSAGHRGLAIERETMGASQRNNRKREIGVAVNTPESINTPSSTNEPVVAPGSHKSPDSDAEMATCPTPAKSEAPAATQAETCASRGGGFGPCKLLSLLAENPAADITQVTAHPSSVDPLQGTVHSEGDVECGKAYEMLMRYATSEEKMDYVARALETGCTSTGQGACAVKKNVIWEALDGMCG